MRADSDCRTNRLLSAGTHVLTVLTLRRRVRKIILQLSYRPDQ